MVAIGMLMPREPRTESVPEKKQDIAAAPPTPVTSAPEPAPIAPKPEAPEKVAAPKPEPVPPAAPIRIPYKGKMRVNTPEVFASYKSELDTAVTPELLGYLDEVVKLMKSNSTLMLRIEGHADNFGASAAETQRISDERALQVVRFMMSQGIARSRLLASGFGARNPVASNRTPQGRAANRRVEISILRP
jgi:outer membrane protein OmpA-like peptidoglycan-associated protein